MDWAVVCPGDIELGCIENLADNAGIRWPRHAVGFTDTKSTDTTLPGSNQSDRE